MLKPGDLAVLKTSDEMVFIISVDPNTADLAGVNHNPSLSGFTVQVRRPIATEAKGIVHVTERYLLEEVESPEEKRSRLKREYEEFKKTALSSKDSTPSEDLPN